MHSWSKFWSNESRDHPLDASRALPDSGEPEITDQLIDQISGKPVDNYDYGQLPTEASKGKKFFQDRQALLINLMLAQNPKINMKLMLRYTAANPLLKKLWD